MSENYDLDSLFHPNVEMGAASSKNTDEYTPSADKGQNGIYKSIIRFVTWWEDPQPHIFAASLIKAIAQNPEEKFTIYTRFPKKTCESIRRRIEIQLESKCPTAIGHLDLHYC